MEKQAEEELAQQIAGLRVTPEEKASVFQLQDGEIDRSELHLANSILCKIYTNKKINIEIFKSMMPKIWNQEQTVIGNVGYNTFLCKLKNARIKGWILDMGPWFYDKALLLFEEPKGGICSDEMDFRYVSFWTHFHKLPYACFTMAAAETIGGLLGKVEKVDIKDESDPSWGRSLRIKIQLDVRKPLKRGIIFKAGSKGKDKWIPVTYEKLPDFCYGCGCLGHIIKECEDPAGTCEEELLYGPGLREPVRLKSEESGTNGRGARSRGRGRGWNGGRGSWRQEVVEGEDEDETDWAQEVMDELHCPAVAIPKVAPAPAAKTIQVTVQNSKEERDAVKEKMFNAKDEDQGEQGRKLKEKGKVGENQGIEINVKFKEIDPPIGSNENIKDSSNMEVDTNGEMAENKLVNQEGKICTDKEGLKKEVQGGGLGIIGPTKTKGWKRLVEKQRQQLWRKRLQRLLKGWLVKNTKWRMIWRVQTRKEVWKWKMK